MRSIISNRFFSKSKTDLILNISKIIIIVFTGIFLLGSFVPFLYHDTSGQFAVLSINLSEGVYSLSNELLQETGRSEFVSNNFLKTVDNTAVPRAGPRISIIGAPFYLIGGYYGLFYLTPIFAILFIIISERVATSFFGKYVGLLTLLFLVTSNLLFRNSIRLQSDVVFSVFIVLGGFFILRYFKEKKDWNLLAGTSLFVFASILRINGVAFFPAEILLIGGYFLIKTISKNRNPYEKNKLSQLIFSKFFQKKTAKIIIFLFLPWLFFIAGYALYHDHFFGDPFTNYQKIKGNPNYQNSLSSLVGFESQDFENLKEYSKYLLPYQFAAIHNRLGNDYDEVLDDNWQDIIPPSLLDNNYERVLGDNWPGIILLSLLFSALLLSLYTKKKRTVIIVLLILIIANLWFYSSITTAERAAEEGGVAGRYMIPVFAFSSMMISYLIIRGFEAINFKRNILKGIKIFFGIVLAIFFLGAFYFSPPGQAIAEGDIQFTNPKKIVDEFPLDKEGINENTVILSKRGDRAYLFGAIPFSITLQGEISEDSTLLLKEILDDGYKVLTYKKSFVPKDIIIYKEITEIGFVLKDHNDLFCKVELATLKNIKNDEVCFKD